jgi:hypothetical protein
MEGKLLFKQLIICKSGRYVEGVEGMSIFRILV